MSSLLRSLCLDSATTKLPRLIRATYSKDGVVFSWPLPELGKWHTRVQKRHRSDLPELDRAEGLPTRNGILVNPGDTVELKDGTFLRVKKVLSNDLFQGWKFVRNRETYGLPKHDPNELYWAVHLTSKGPQLGADQTLVEVEGSQFLRKRRMTMVNTVPTGDQKRLEDRNDGPLFCRWKHIIVTKINKLIRPLDAFSLPTSDISEASFRRLREEECDDEYRSHVADQSLRQSWLEMGKRKKADNKSKEGNPLPSFEALSLDDNTQGEFAPKRYTFADICCGAGGASWGAQKANLELRWALDHDASACVTYRLNFPQVQLYQDDLAGFVPKGRPNLKVDIMHASLPCQDFPQGNVRPNPEKDAMNIATNMELGRCLDIAKPRIATLEQTDGLMLLGHKQMRHSTHFDRLIELFISRGYSVAWKIVNLADFGLPQNRRRLIMIASCIGETLPDFPNPTHTNHPGNTDLKRFTSVNDAINIIPSDCPNNNLPPKLNPTREAYDGNKLLPHILMTRAATDAHPDGLRRFSIRELACLQSFPIEHRFAATAGGGPITKQIGNAFPPTMAEVLFTAMKRHLLKQDGLMSK
ncbi:MAG: hypothetical protein Q9182_001486 [Xanthomendoza sp. 2 TL-2023]